jgi:O-antigen/teichoic acid export membrane protein
MNEQPLPAHRQFFSRCKQFLFVNSSPKQTVAKNTLRLLIAEAVNKGSMFAIMLILAKYLWPEQFWIFSYIVSFIALFSIVVDYGLVNVVIREVSKEPEHTQAYFIHGIYLKVLLGVLNFAVVRGISFFVEWGTVLLHLLMIFCAYSIVNNIWEYIRVLFRPQELMQHEAGVKIINGVLFFGIVAFATWSWWTLETILYAFLFSGVLNLLISGIYIFRHFRFGRANFRFAGEIFSWLLKKWFLIALGVFFINITINFDQFLLGYLGRSYELGIYALGYKMTFIYTVIFAMFFQTLLPRVSKHPTKELYNQWMKRTTIINVSMLIAYGGIAAFFYRQPYRDIGPYQASILVFLSLLLYCIFESYGHRSYIHLLALRKERLMLGIFALCAGFNMGANLLLIPSYWYRWAIGVTIATYMLYFALSYLAVRRSYQRMLPA